MSELEDNMAHVRDLARAHMHSFTTEQFDEIMSLADHAEPAVAFEMFCSLLYEYDRPVDIADLEEFTNLSQRMRISPTELKLWRNELGLDDD